MSNILAITTSSPVLSVALQTQDGKVHEKKEEGFLSHAEKLLPLIDANLNDAGIKLDEVDCLLIDRGPGSFTGLRIGFATLKGISVLRNPEFWGALSLDLIARNVPPSPDAPLAVCQDAHREKFYVKEYIAKDNEWTSDKDCQILSHEEALEKLKPESLVTGDGLNRYRDKFLDSPKKLRVLEADQWYPRASELISLYTQKKNIQKLEKPEDFVPLYFRKSEAEERREERA